MNAKKTVDMLIVNGDIFTGDSENPHIRAGSIAINNGVIVAIGPEQETLATYQSSQTIDANNGPVHPGFTDTHLHFITTALHGLPHDFTVRGRPDYGLTAAESLLPTYSKIKLATDDESTSALAAAASIALLRRGFTCFMEAGSVFEVDAFADALTQCGMRGMVSAPYGWDNYEAFFAAGDYAYANHDILTRAPSGTGRVIDACTRELRRNRDENALVRGYVCLYGMGTGTDELITEGINLAHEHDVLFYQHQNPEAESAATETRLFGENGIARLNRLGALGPKTTLSHMNALTQEEADIIVSTRPGISWCPFYSVHMGVYPNQKVYFPGFYKAGLNVSLGSDVPIADSIGTMGSASLLISTAMDDRLLTSDPFYMQTIKAANCMALGDQLGSLSCGKRADIVIRKVEDIMQSPLDDHGRLLALDAASMPVDTVIIDGRKVMAAGRMTTVDQDEVLMNALQQRQRLLNKALN